MRRPGARIATLLIATWLVAVACSGDGSPTAAVRTTRPVAFVASSFHDAARAVLGKDAVVQAASSATLARQIERGADAALFVSAHPEWVDRLVAAGLVVEGSARDLVGNELVVIRRSDSGATSFPWSLADARKFAGRIAIGDPGHVPAGRYALAGLRERGLDRVLGERLVPAHDVRAALRYVLTGAVDFGIVYRTDALSAGERVRVLPAPAEVGFPPVIYRICRLRDAGETAAARAAFDVLCSDAEQQGGRLARLGFSLRTR